MVSLYYFEGLTVKEIAYVLKVSSRVSTCQGGHPFARALSR